VTQIDVLHRAEELDKPITIGLFLDVVDDNGENVVMAKDFSCEEAEALAYRILREIELYEAHPRHVQRRMPRLVADVNAPILNGGDDDDVLEVPGWRCCERHG